MKQRPRLAAITSIRRRLRLALTLLFLGLVAVLLLLVLLPSFVQRVATHPAAPRDEHGLTVFTIPTDADPGKTAYPPFLLHHMTRYAKGCVDPLLNGDLRRAGHRAILPIVHEFDHMYAYCGLRWFRPKGTSTTVCLYRRQPNASLPIYRVNQSTRSRTLRVHVSSEGPQPLVHFLAHALPRYAADVARGDVAGIALHYGGGDLSLSDAAARRLLHGTTNGTTPSSLPPPSAVVVRLVVEQNTLPWLAKEDRVVLLPSGLCAVRAHGGSGAFLDAALHPTRAHNTTTTTTTSSSSSIMAPALSWDARSTKVFFCFHTRYPHRQAYMHFAVHRCPAAVARWSRTVRPTPPTHLTRDHWMRRAFGHLP